MPVNEQRLLAAIFMVCAIFTAGFSLASFSELVEVHRSLRDAKIETMVPMAPSAIPIHGMNQACWDLLKSENSSSSRIKSARNLCNSSFVILVDSSISVSR